jgi:hypothetical protein
MKGDLCGDLVANVERIEPSDTRTVAATSLVSILGDPLDLREHDFLEPLGARYRQPWSSTSTATRCGKVRSVAGDAMVIRGSSPRLWALPRRECDRERSSI